MGAGGTGKSFLIRQIKAMFKDQVRVTASTGIAAFSIDGCTIHSLLHLPVRTYQRKNLSAGSLLRLQNRLKGVKYIVIDELSMIGQRCLFWIHKRLQQITGNLHLRFGGISIILIGDHAQLPPVSDKRMYVRPHAEENHEAWTLYREFNIVIFLDEIKRQEADSKFQKLLSHVRNHVVSEADWKYLMSRSSNHLSQIELDSFKDAIHLFRTNQECTDYNIEKLVELKQPIAKIFAQHSPAAAAKSDANLAGGLLPILHLCKECNVMLTCNINVRGGLTNGSMGKVISIIYDFGVVPPNLPRAVLVQFPAFKGPSILPDIPGVVPIQAVTNEWKVGNQMWSRQQLPLRLCYGITIHKSQGQTLDKCVIKGLHDSRYKQPGIEYVALSRVKSINNLVIDPMSLQEFRKLNRPDKERCTEERRLRRIFENMKQDIIDFNK